MILVKTLARHRRPPFGFSRSGMDVFGFTGASDTPEFQGKMLQKAGAKRIFTDFIHIAEALGY